MMVDPKNRKKTRYLYQASAMAASGRITRPFCDVIPAHASATLPSTGGYYSARMESFRYKEILSFASAYSEVTGSDDASTGLSDTLALTVIEKLNILDVVTCDRVVSRISSKSLGKEPTFTTVGSRFERLRIGEHFFECLDLGAGEVCTSWADLCEAVLKGGRTPAPLSAPDGTPVPILKEKNSLPRMFGFCLATVPGESPEKERTAIPPIKVPQFGTVHLGEYFVSQYSRRLVMLRVEMGCPVGGDASAGDTFIHGDSFPP